jgi:hypothetical protein
MTIHNLSLSNAPPPRLHFPFNSSYALGTAGRCPDGYDGYAATSAASCVAVAPQVGWDFAKTGAEFKGDPAFVALGTPVKTDSNHVVSSKCYLWTGAGAAFKGLKYAPEGTKGGLYDPMSTPICEKVGAATTTAAPTTT